MLIVDLDELNFRELFKILHERARNRIECAIRLTTAREVDVGNAVSKCKFAITIETVEHESKSLVAFDIARTFEIFVKHCTDQIP